VAEGSYTELAGILNLPLDLVRSRLHRARREMERAMCARAREAGILPAA
jgi:DNA-directed RNA polymerase specialized sigma24 family protein